MADSFIDSLVDLSRLATLSQPAVTPVTTNAASAVTVVQGNNRRALLLLSGDGVNAITIGNTTAIQAGKGFLLTPQNAIVVWTQRDHGLLPTLPWFAISAAPGTISFLEIVVATFPSETPLPDITDLGYRKQVYENAIQQRNKHLRTKLRSDRWRERPAISLDDIPYLSDSGMG